MTTPVGSALQRLLAHSTEAVLAVHRLGYEFADDGEEPSGELHLQFATGVVRFRPSPAGDEIDITDLPWTDPFDGRETPENIEFLERHGRWRSHDVSALPGYRSLVGKRVTAATPLAATGRMVGVRLVAGDVALLVSVDGDELCISWEPAALEP